MDFFFLSDFEGFGFATPVPLPSLSTHCADHGELCLLLNLPCALQGPDLLECWVWSCNLLTTSAELEPGRLFKSPTVQ